MLARNTIFIDFLRITLPKLHVKFKPNPLEMRKGRKSEKKRINYA